MKRFLLALCVLLSVSATAMAADWVECYRGAGGTYFFDSSFVAVDGDLLKTKLKMDDPNPRAKSFTLSDLSFRKSPALFYRLENLSLYYGPGQAPAVTSKDEGWRRVVPYSDMESVYLFVSDFASKRGAK